MEILQHFRRQSGGIKLARITPRVFNQSERLGLALVALAVVVSRWWGRSQYLHASDSALYALALDRYNVVWHRPHPPGYALYIFFAKPFYWLTGDANLSFVILGIIFSVLAGYAVFYLAKRVYNLTVAWLSLLILVSSPLVWFHGQVALSYISDVFFSVWFGYHIYQALVDPRDKRSLLWATIILAVGGGFRPTLVLFLAPLWFWVMWRRRINLREFLTYIGALVGITLLWLIPSVYLSGGPGLFWLAIKTMFFVRQGIYSISVFHEGVGRLVNNLRFIFGHLSLNFGLAGLLAIIFATSFLFPKQVFDRAAKQRILFWCLWILPALIFYVVMIFNMPGYLLILIPALTILVAVGVIALVQDIGLAFFPHRHSMLTSRILIVLTILFLSTNAFVYYRPEKVIQMQRATHFAIRTSDSLWRNLAQTIPQNFNPQNTIIGVDQPFVSWGFPQFEYYFPGYRVFIHTTWGIYNPEQKQWFLARQRSFQLADTLEILPTDTKLIVVRADWNRPSPPALSIPLGDIGYLTYYDLSDPSAREIISKIADVHLLIDQNNSPAL